MNDKKKLVLIIISLIALTIVSNFWVTSSRNSFIFDDYTHIHTAKFKTYENLFNVMPQSRYNDRPVGSIAIKIMYYFFGMNYQYYHFVLLLLHIFNVLLLFFLVKKVLVDIKVDKHSFNMLPLLVASFFAVWPKSVFCVQWISAIFDLLGATFFLLVLNLYISTVISKKYRLFNSILIVFFIFWV